MNILSECQGSRYATQEEIMSSTSLIDFSKHDNTAGGIPFISDGKNAWVDSSFFHTCIIGSTGAGKTRSLILPTIFSLIYQSDESKSSLIIHDPKGEIVGYTYNSFLKAGYRVHILNLKELNKGTVRYNPLEIPAKLYQKGEESKGIELFCSVAEGIFSEAIRTARDPFWARSAQLYCSGLFICAAQYFPAEKINFDLIYSIHSATSDKSMGDYLLNMLYRDDKDNPAWRMLSTCLEAAVETRKSIYCEFDNAFSSLILNRELIDLTSGSPEVRAEDFVKQPVVFFIVTNDIASFSTNIAGVIIEQLYQQIVWLADTKYKGTLPRRLEFILDEFSTLPPLRDINQKISSSRSRNIRYTLCVQSLNQLTYVYGQDLAMIIVANVNNLLYMYSPDIALHQYLEKRSGVQVTEYSEERRSLILPEFLARFEPGEVLVFHGNEYPFYSELPDISEYKCDINMFYTYDLPKRKLLSRSTPIAKDVLSFFKTIIEESIDSELHDHIKSILLKHDHRRLALRIVPPIPGLAFCKLEKTGRGNGTGEKNRDITQYKNTYHIIKDGEILDYYEVIFFDERILNRSKKDGIVLFYLNDNDGPRKYTASDLRDVYVALYNPDNKGNIKIKKRKGLQYMLNDVDSQKTFKTTDLLIAYLEGIISHMEYRDEKT